MCWNRRPDPTPPPPVLPPPPPPPLPPSAPPPDPTPVETDINPAVQKARTRKDKNAQTKGTGALRIKLDPAVNTGGNTTPSGGVNK